MSARPQPNYSSVEAGGGGGLGGPRPAPLYRQGKSGGATLGIREIVLLVALPSFLSFVVYALFANIYHSTKSVWLVIAILVLFSSFLCWRFRGQNGITPLAFYLAAFCLVATLLSTAIGITSYDVAFSKYWFLHESNSYTNVLVTESSLAYADAGKLVFADGTRIDAGKALGYKDGKTYCVAPIMDDMMGGAVEFWAVGIDCCSVRGSFWCDDAWNPKARSGIAVQDPNGHYADAVRQAEAAFEIAASVRPLLVRWVVDPEQVQTNYRLVGIAILVSAFLVQLLLFTMGALGLNSTMPGLAHLFR